MRLILIIFLFFVHFFPAQNVKQMTIKQIDSTLKSMESDVYDMNGKNLITLYTDLYYRTKELNYTKGQINTLQKLCLFRVNSNKDFEKVIEDSETIEKLAESIGDYYNFCIAKIDRSFVYMRMGLSNKAKESADEALKFAEKVKDKDRRLDVYAHAYYVYVTYYEQINDFKNKKYFAEKGFEKTLQMSEQFPPKLNWLLNSTRILENLHFQKGNYPQAGYYLKLQEGYLKKSKNKLDFALYHLLKAEFESKNKTNNKDYLEHSIHHFKEAEKYSKQINNATFLTAIYSEISEVYAEKKDFKNQAIYLKKEKNIKDSLSKIEKETLQKINPKIADKSSETPNQNSWMYFLTGLVFLVAALFFFFKFKNKKKETQHPKVTELEPKVSVSVNELVYSDENPAVFNEKFQLLFPGFYDGLRNVNTELTSSELEFCAFIKLNFDTKKIASIKDISVRAVESKKYRIRKKLNLSGEEDLYIWMSNFH